jgi:hypothetical protein
MAIGSACLVASARLKSSDLLIVPTPFGLICTRLVPGRLRIWPADYNGLETLAKRRFATMREPTIR